MLMPLDGDSSKLTASCILPDIMHNNPLGKYCSISFNLKKKVENIVGILETNIENTY